MSQSLADFRICSPTFGASGFTKGEHLALLDAHQTPHSLAASGQVEVELKWPISKEMPHCIRNQVPTLKVRTTWSLLVNRWNPSAVRIESKPLCQLLGFLWNPHIEPKFLSESECHIFRDFSPMSSSVDFGSQLKNSKVLPVLADGIFQTVTPAA